VAYEGRRRRVGVIEAGSEAEVARAVAAAGWFLVSVAPVGAGRPRALVFARAGGPQLAFFFRQLAAVVRMGLPLTRALSVQARSATGAWRRVLRGLEARVRGGDSLADAMAAYPGFFRPLFVEVVRAGERSGTADAALERCAGYVQAEHGLRQKVRSAMVYPLVVLLFAASGGAYLVAAVLPKITRMFLELEVPLPLPTRALIGLTVFLQHRGPLVLAALGAMLVLLAAGPRLPGVRLLVDGFLLRLPGVGQVVRASALSRFLRVLAEGLEVGLALRVALELSSRSLGNGALERQVAPVVPRAVSGAGLAAALEQSRVFPPLVPQVVRLGEESGTVPRVLKELAGYYEGEADRAVKSAVALVEPVMVFAVAGVVGFLALAIIMPIYAMVGRLAGG
jgi:type IV pilus assembly protein PilC